MILARPRVTAPMCATRFPVQRRCAMVRSSNPIADLVIAAIAFGVIHDVSSTLLKKRIPTDVIDPIVIDDDETCDKNENTVPAETLDDSKYTDVDFDVREE